MQLQTRHDSWRWLLRTARLGQLVRLLLLLATTHGLWCFSVHLRLLFRGLMILSKVPLWAPPLFFCHLTATLVRVVWRRLWGSPRSQRWNTLVEFFIQAVRPKQIFRRNWEACVDPAVNMMTHLDYMMELLARLCHPKVHIEFVTQGCPRPITWIWFEESNKPAKADSPDVVILYLHGGGHWAFTGRSHLEYVARIMKNLQAIELRGKACVVDLRRAPEHPWPAPMEDALACFDWLQQGCGISPKHIVLAGDSAGGGLCLCVAAALRDSGKPLPVCSTVVSPLTDLGRPEEQYPDDENLQTDFLPPEAVLVSSKRYAPEENPRNPLISPKYGQLHALPPVLIQAGEGELLARDSREYAKRLEAYGGTVQLEMYPDMPHIFPMLAPLGLQDADVAIARQARFISSNLSGGRRAHGRRHKAGLRVLVHDKRTQSFEDLRAEACTAFGMKSFTSSPMLTSAPCT